MLSAIFLEVNISQPVLQLDHNGSLEASAGHRPLPSIPNRLGCSRPGWLTWLRSLEMWSCRARATPHLSVALFQGKQLNPKNSFPVQTTIIPLYQRGEVEGERSWAPCGTKHFKHVSQKDEQPWMAKQTDGGRRREAHDTGETIIISVISSNHSSTAAFPSLSACYTHRHKPMAKKDFDICCTLNSSALKKV